MSGNVACFGNDGIVRIGNVTVARVAPGSELQEGHDRYEAMKYNHGQYRDSSEGGRDVMVDSQMTVKSAKVSIPGITEWIANATHFRGIVASLDADEIEKLADVLKDAVYENEGAQMFYSVKLTSPEHRIVRVVLVVTKATDDNCIKFLMVNHKELAQCREGLAWRQKWHEDAANQKMLTDWCTYRMLGKLGNEGLAVASDFFHQKPIDDEMGPAPGPRVEVPAPAGFPSMAAPGPRVGVPAPAGFPPMAAVPSVAAPSLAPQLPAPLLARTMASGLRMEAPGRKPQPSGPKHASPKKQAKDSTPSFAHLNVFRESHVW